MRTKLFALMMMVALSATIFSGCEPDEPVTPATPPVVPKVSTIEVLQLDNTKVNVLSVIVNDGGAEIKEAGICWRNDTTAPTVLGLKKQAYVKMGDYSIELNVGPGRTYTVRAYALNSVGIAYGECITFTTDSLPPPPPPEPRLAQISDGTMLQLTSNSANFSATVIDSGFCLINEIGVCWSKTGIPDIYDYRQATSNTNVGEFTISAPDLEMLSDYTARVYVTNIVGTNYGEPISFCTYDSVVDADGNVYYGVKIGNQVWLTENLKTTHFNNGDAINYVTDDGEWVDSANPGYCWFNNDASRANTPFGALYNRKVVTDQRGIAPEGYHIPSKEDMMTFGEHFGVYQLIYEGTVVWTYVYNGGSAIRTNVYWLPILRGNNSSGFTAHPTGFREDQFYAKITNGYWWTTSLYDEDSPYVLYTGGEMINDRMSLTTASSPCFGSAIRCVKD